jgi:hypothetical protein
LSIVHAAFGHDANQGFFWQNRQRKKLMPVKASGCIRHIDFGVVARGATQVTG